MATTILLLVALAAGGVIAARQYKRCPPNQVLVVTHRWGGTPAARAIQDGGVFVVPFLQDSQLLSLDPIKIDINLTEALTKTNERVNGSSTFVVQVSTEPEVLPNAAERLVGLSDDEIASQAHAIISGQLRLTMAELTVEEINADRREGIESLAHESASRELAKIGLEVEDVTIRYHRVPYKPT